LLAAALAGFWLSDNSVAARFKEYFPWDPLRGGKSFAEAQVELMPRLKESPRYNMYSGALRAWRETDPRFGIGPGMHQHLWLHYAASPDGDRARGIWPSRPNNGYHSYEVHSDWIQLLEEYGVVGFVLFLFAVGALTAFLRRGFRSGIVEPVAFGGILCLVCMAFHSLGDFNLQMPATTWLLSAVVAIPFAWIQRYGA
jgi:O-antigen ligase